MGESPNQDLTDAGGLRAVIESACPDCEIELREFPGGHEAMASRGDRAVRVFQVRDKRLFWLSYRLRTTFLNRVSTTDLAVCTGSLATWLGGATPREFAAAWPFAGFVDVADAYESGDRTELAWQRFRLHDRFRLDEFVEAAAAEPRLRRMFPFTSMFWMSFRPTAEEYTVPGPWVRGLGDGRFTVGEDRYAEPDITYAAVEAVRVCLAEMDRLGVPGPAEIDLDHVRPAARAPEHRRDLAEGDRAATYCTDRREHGYPVTFKWRKETMAHAWAPDSAAAAGAAQAWVGGATPRELTLAWPFVDFVAVGEAFERGELLDYEWQQTRARAMYGLRPFVDAAMREPQLRRLWPATSAHQLGFKPAETERWLSRPRVKSLAGGRFVVLAEHGEVLGEGDVEQALSICLRELTPR